MSLPIGLQLWSIWEAVGEDMFASQRGAALLSQPQKGFNRYRVRISV